MEGSEPADTFRRSLLLSCEAPDGYCGAGKCISGALVEKLTYVSSYRGELLGLLAIWLFLLAVEEYYGVATDGSSLACAIIRRPCTCLGRS